MELKLDVVKANDRVEWDFLKNILLRFGLSNAWVKLVISCVELASLLILVYGSLKLSGFLGNSTRWFAFSLSFLAQRFLSIIQDATTSGRLIRVAIPSRSPSISRLLFVDDSIIFFHDLVSCLHELREILWIYNHATIQRVNISKSSTFFTPSINPARKAFFQATLGTLVFHHCLVDVKLTKLLSSWWVGVHPLCHKQVE